MRCQIAHRNGVLKRNRENPKVGGRQPAHQS